MTLPSKVSGLFLISLFFLLVTIFSGALVSSAVIIEPPSPSSQTIVNVNSSVVNSFNATYDIWAHNQTTPAVTLLNTTYAFNWYNHSSATNLSIFTVYDARWSTTYNVSYLINGSLANGILNISGNNIYPADLAKSLGIGTATLAYRLDILDTSDNALRLTSTRNVDDVAMFVIRHNRGTASVTNEDTNQINFIQDSDTTASAITSSIQQVIVDKTTAAGGGLAFSTGGIGPSKERARITPAGNLGVGGIPAGARIDSFGKIRSNTAIGTGLAGNASAAISNRILVGNTPNANESMILLEHTGTQGNIGTTYGSNGNYVPLVLRTSDLDRLLITVAGQSNFYGTVNATSFRLDDNKNFNLGGANDWTLKANATSFYIQRDVGTTDVAIPSGDIILQSGFLMVANTSFSPLRPVTIIKQENQFLGSGNTATSMAIVNPANLIDSIAEVQFGGKAGPVGLGGSVGYLQQDGGGNTRGDIYIATRKNTADGNFTVNLRAMSSTGIINITNGIQVTNNASIGMLMQLTAYELPACNTAMNGSVARNTTGFVYGCNTTEAWTRLF